MPDLVITGATGFLGSHLLDSLKDSGKHIKALTRALQKNRSDLGNVEWVAGDITDKTVWDQLVTPGCTVINLAYSQISTTEEAIVASQVMSQACSRNSAFRLIHCSTTSVYGRSAEGAVDESTPCHPTDDYGQRKLAVEHTLTNCNAGYELVILRPTSVFGIGGKALAKISQSLLHGSGVTNYLRSSLFSSRRMHLVPVAAVTSAINFLAGMERCLDKEVFIVSADDNPDNNFRYVEKILMDSFGLKDYVIPPMPLPSSLLRSALFLMNKSEIDPQCNYSMRKLTDLGFVSPISLEAALREFASSHISRPDH